jgi:tRNA threonylcarbamoyladenosine biosynthesis protein TsaB
VTIKILALDTSTEACSAALFSDTKVIESFELAPRQHNKLLLPMLEALLTESNIKLEQLNAIAFGCGPGSFTGLRLAASVVQGIAFAHNLPVVPVSTLRVLAQGAYREFNATQVLSSLDAYVKEIYWGVYHLNNDKIMTATSAEIMCVPNDINFSATENNCLGVGSGWDRYAEILQTKAGNKLQQWLPNRYPHAQDVAVLAAYDFKHGKAVAAEHALPVYLREELFKK